jgi:hypothetical protein
MKRWFTFACGLALTGACTGTPASAKATVGQPAAQGTSNLVSAKPASAAASAEPAAASAEATAGKPAEAAATRGSADASAGRPVATGGAAAGTASTPASPIEPAYREVTLPSGTVLPIDLETAVGSDTSRVEQPVSGRLRRAVSLAGAEVLPVGTVVSGHVTAAQRPGKVKGRGMIAMRFTRMDTPGAGQTAISTATISRLAPATKKDDAVKIGAPAAAGAVIGGILGGKGGAGKGAIIGGGAGTGYVLSTRGKNVRLAKGADLSVKLTAPLMLRVLVR